jgi:hypothetical protein
MHVLLFLKFQSHTDRLRQWVTMGVALLVLGIILHFSHGINRYQKKACYECLKKCLSSSV